MCVGKIFERQLDHYRFGEIVVWQFVWKRQPQPVVVQHVRRGCQSVGGRKRGGRETGNHTGAVGNDAETVVEINRKRFHRFTLNDSETGTVQCAFKWAQQFHRFATCGFGDFNKNLRFVKRTNQSRIPKYH